jgi:hypothetical protein
MPASLRSERDRLGIGTSGRNQIGISDSFRRNQHKETLLVSVRLSVTTLSLPVVALVGVPWS